MHTMAAVWMISLVLLDSIPPKARMSTIISMTCMAADASLPYQAILSGIDEGADTL